MNELHDHWESPAQRIPGFPFTITAKSRSKGVLRERGRDFKFCLFKWGRNWNIMISYENLCMFKFLIWYGE